MCFVTASVSRNAGGLQDGVLRLAQSCGAADLSIIGVEDEFTAADIHGWSPLRIQTSRVVGPKRFSYAPGLARNLDAAQVEVAHLHGLWRYTSIAVSRWHRRTSKPYIVHPHGMLDCWAVRNSRWKKTLASVLYERSMLDGAACIRALCLPEAESIQNYGCRNPVCVIPNGIDLPKGPFGPPAWHGHLEPGTKVLFYLGRLHPKKGLMNLLRAWAATNGTETRQSGGKSGPRAGHNWVLVIAGWGEGGHEAELKRLADELKLHWTDVREAKASCAEKSGGPGGLIFIGPQFGKVKADCYHHSDAFVLPSVSEGLPMVILEAWAHSKLVLMTPACNLPEGITSNAGIEIGTEPAEIGTGLLRLVALSQSEREEIGKNGLLLISKKFTWERVADQLLAVSEWVVNGGAPPECMWGGQTARNYSTAGKNGQLTSRDGVTRPLAETLFESRSDFERRH